MLKPAVPATHQNGCWVPVQRWHLVLYVLAGFPWISLLGTVTFAGWGMLMTDCFYWNSGWSWTSIWTSTASLVMAGYLSLGSQSGKEPFYHFQILAIINNVAMNIFGFVSWHTWAYASLFSWLENNSLFIIMEWFFFLAISHVFLSFFYIHVLG